MFVKKALLKYPIAVLHSSSYEKHRFFAGTRLANYNEAYHVSFTGGFRGKKSHSGQVKRENVIKSICDVFVP